MSYATRAQNNGSKIPDYILAQLNRAITGHRAYMSSFSVCDSAFLHGPPALLERLRWQDALVECRRILLSQTAESSASLISTSAELTCAVNHFMPIHEPDLRWEIYSLFSGLNAIRDKNLEIWQLCDSGDTNLVSASIQTQQCFDAIVLCVRSFGTRNPGKLSLKWLVQTIFNNQALGQYKPPDNAEGITRLAHAYEESGFEPSLDLQEFVFSDMSTILERLVTRRSQRGRSDNASTMMDESTYSKEMRSAFLILNEIFSTIRSLPRRVWDQGKYTTMDRLTTYLMTENEHLLSGHSWLEMAVMMRLLVDIRNTVDVARLELNFKSWTTKDLKPEGSCSELGRSPWLNPVLGGLLQFHRLMITKLSTTRRNQM